MPALTHPVPVATAADLPAKRMRRSSLAYRALLVFSFLYYTRPEDLIPGLGVIPIGKITGGIAVLALIAGLSGKKSKAKFPLEMKLLLLLLLQLCLCVPFAYWRGGAVSTITDKFSKGVIVALLVTLVVENMDQLRKLLYVQAAAVAAMTTVSVLLHPGGVRLEGVLGGIFSNPNDLAINIAINWPLCLAFLLAARGGLRKTLWAAGLLFMLYATIATYSRSGSLAMVMALMICVWQFGVRGKRIGLLVAAALVAMVAAGVAVSTPNYTARLRSIVQGDVAGSQDRGSWDARRELLNESVSLALHNPVFGIGPGNFPAVTKTWEVAHNTYTEFAAETGLPGLLLFVAILALAFGNLRKIRKAPAYQQDKLVQLFAGALWASLAAYLVGAAFSSTEYNLFPYFMVAYTSAMYRIVSTRAINVPAIQSLTPAERVQPSASPTQRRWVMSG